ncbi:MAG: PadR family transcriptional regulator [Actinomycetota bacterium]|nr:PadR family transcriptional regulator [Actinomycetota bacterium]
MSSEAQFGWMSRPPAWLRGTPWRAMASGHGGGEHGVPGRRGGRFGDPGSGGPGSGGPGSGGPGFGGPGFGGPPGWGGWGGRGRGRGGRGGRARRGDVRAAVLLLLAETPRNGYQIIQELAERSRGAWRPSPGSVYPVLQQLEDEGLVVSTTAEVGRQYQVTEAGRTYVDSHRDTMGVPWEEAANSVGRPAMEFAQLIPQVVGAMKQVLHAGTDHQITQASAVLAQTRRALYRILAEDTPETAEAPEAPEAESNSDRGTEA